MVLIESHEIVLREVEVEVEVDSGGKVSVSSVAECRTKL